MKLYAFDGIDETLELLPIASRRALDAAGLKLSRAGWNSLSLAERCEVCELGAAREVDVTAVREIALRGIPAPELVPSMPELDPTFVPSELSRALGPEQPLGQAVWSALEPLDRYALSKAARSKSPDRLPRAYTEIVGASAFSTHVAPAGGARMVGVSDKLPGVRRAVAESAVSMSEEAFLRLERADAPKGDVLGTARIAGIQAAKRTWELIPLCHPIALTRVDVSFELVSPERLVRVRAAVEAFDRTGVEMEALTAASLTALTIYDMLKAFDRTMLIGPTRLLEKSGGRSGDYKR